jgi:uncharacterized protein
MTIVLAGGSGFLGRALQAHFSQHGHDVRVLTRHPRPGATHDIHWLPDGRPGPWATALDDADVIVNLAGEGIADKRWTAARKDALRASRILAGRTIAAALSAAPKRPRTLITSCAIGYYGARGDEPVTEETPPGNDFLASLCVDWEREAGAPASPLTHAAILRTGIVLHPEGGALKSMLTPFRLGIGGSMGTGRQYMSWIHLDDWVALIAWLATSRIAPADHALADGALRNTSVWNTTAPVPVTNGRFAAALGAAIGRPALIPAPAFGLKLMLGEFANFLLTGARVLPAHAERAGFTFRYRELEPALADLLGAR